MDQMISCTPAVEVREIKAVITKEMTKGWDCVSLWRVKECVYTSVVLLTIICSRMGEGKISSVRLRHRH